jgi:Arc/MetJ-type ribon-helix-helix transcriptional regulator
MALRPTYRKLLEQWTTNRTLTDSEIEALADEAEAGYDIDHLVTRRKRGRPTLGSAPASVESVRLDPELKDQLLLRAEQDHTSPSAVIREALRRYLQPS